MRKFWILLATLLAVLAVVFAVLQDFEKAFVLAAAGAVSWFLSYRVQMRQLVDSIDERKKDEQASSDEES